MTGSGEAGMQIASRLPGVGTTIFTVMSRLAAEHGPRFEPAGLLRERARTGQSFY